MLVLSDIVYVNKDHHTVNSSLGGRHYVHYPSSAHIQTISTLPLLVYLYCSTSAVPLICSFLFISILVTRNENLSFLLSQKDFLHL